VGGNARHMSTHVTQTSLADDAQQQQQVRGDVTRDVTAQSSTQTELQERRHGGSDSDGCDRDLE